MRIDMRFFRRFILYKSKFLYSDTLVGSRGRVWPFLCCIRTGRKLRADARARDAMGKGGGGIEEGKKNQANWYAAHTTSEVEEERVALTEGGLGWARGDHCYSAQVRINTTSSSLSFLRFLIFFCFSVCKFLSTSRQRGGFEKQHGPVAEVIRNASFLVSGDG